VACRLGSALVRHFALLLLVLCLFPGIGIAQQQHADAHFTPRVPHPAYAGDGPVVAIDQAHRNFHTLEGRYAPFGRLLTADGYRVRASTAPFSAQALGEVNVLVIANALSATRGTSAFAPDEIASVRQWVENGGSLLLIADHAPFGSAAKALAAAFGVNLDTGFAVVRQDGTTTANIQFRGRLLGQHPILEGRDASERIKAVQSFTGESLSVPAGATELLILPRDAIGVLNRDDIQTLARGGSVDGMRIGGRAQAIAFNFGRGRVVVAGEAAMFTEQDFLWGDHVGLTTEDDQQFALNVLHWLTRLI